MGALVAGICMAHGVQHQFSYTHKVEPTVNWTENVEPVVRAATAVVGAAEVDGNCPPLLASEDFGAFLRVIPGDALFRGARPVNASARPASNYGPPPQDSTKSGWFSIGVGRSLGFKLLGVQGFPLGPPRGFTGSLVAGWRPT